MQKKSNNEESKRDVTAEHDKIAVETLNEQAEDS